MNPSYGMNFDNYKQLGIKKLKERAKLVRENKEFAKKVSILLDEDASEKRKGTGVPTATQPYLKQVSDEAVEETRGFWDEPDPKSIKKYAAVYTSGVYPYNHVHESESGHIHEMDDTPGGERLFTQHKSGTFEEIHPTGTKVVKVIGDNYEIVS